MLREFNTGIAKERKTFHRRKEDFHFINIDLELRSDEKLHSLVDEMGGKVFVLFNDQPPNLSEYWVSLEINDYDIFQRYDDSNEEVGGVNTILAAFCDLLEDLSAESKELWKQCKKREFDIGFGGGNTAKSFHTQISEEIIGRISKLGASLLFTVYPHLNYELKSE